MGKALTHFFRIFCNDSPPYLKEHVPLPRNISCCFQRPNTLNVVKCRTSKYMNSFSQIVLRLGITLTRIFETVMPLGNIKERFFLLYVEALKNEVLLTLRKYNMPNLLDNIELNTYMVKLSDEDKKMYY